MEGNIHMDIFGLLSKVREQKPLVHHITNWVTIYDCANIVKSFGASPVMAHAREEASDMTRLASSLVLNIGTLTPELVSVMIDAGRAANAKGIPVTLDVCGAGATRLRDDSTIEILDSVDVCIIKGNASEIARVSGEDIRTKGVDAGSVDKDLAGIARALAGARGATVVITGKEDIVTDGSVTYRVSNGCEMMAHVVGTGCMSTSVAGTFAAVTNDYPLAAACGLCCFEIAAEIALVESRGPGTFKEQLFDAVYHLSEEAVRLRNRISIA
jgi:hydroxyethylthiazole kinase